MDGSGSERDERFRDINPVLPGMSMCASPRGIDAVVMVMAMVMNGDGGGNGDDMGLI